MKHNFDIDKIDSESAQPSKLVISDESNSLFIYECLFCGKDE